MLCAEHDALRLFCKLLLSPLPHARVKRIDASEALTMPGVRAILTADDLPAPADTLPSGDHTGHSLALGPKVNREAVPRDRSCSQISTPPWSLRSSATVLPSGEMATQLTTFGAPRVPVTLPDRPRYGGNRVTAAI
jgi:Aldehyde oxidase and xanthine dehydrogenase, a/b hammerhead domain